MPRVSKPWYWKSRRSWYVQISGKRHNLGADRELAIQRYHELMAQPRQTVVQSDTVLAIFDAFLEWTSNHRASRTYDWYRDRLQWFARTIPNLTVRQLKPFHLQKWVDSHPAWSDGHKRGCLVAVQRAFRWAEKFGYIERSPVRYIEKPQAGRRTQIVVAEQYQEVLSASRDGEFRDLLTAAWETGARPQELTRVEARHVDLANCRWVFPPEEAKIKSRPRIIYLSDVAMGITKRLMLKSPEGPIFRNTDGNPWKAYAVNSRFCRLEKKLGVKFCLYNFRHSFATRLLESGVDALTVATLLGHTDVSMLGKVYQHLAHNPGHLLSQVRKAAS